MPPAAFPKPPPVDELAASLYSPDESVTVRGAPGVGIVAIGVRRAPRATSDCSGSNPRPRRRGHGTALLRAAEADLSGQGATSVQVGADPPFYLYPGVETTHTAMLCLLERHRYERGESNFNMGVDLDDTSSRIPAATNWRGPRQHAEVAAWMRQHWPNWEAEAMRALERSTLVISRDARRDRGVLRL